MEERLTQQQRDRKVNVEKKRLLDVYKDIPPNKKKVVEGLIIQAARLRVMLNEMWKDITEKGDYSMFTQSDKQEPYERERPVAKLYNSRNDSYMRIMKQLTDLVPEEKKGDLPPPSDGSDLI